MRLARALSEVEAKKVQTFVLLAGVFTTLTIWTKLEDPINLPKMFVLVLFAAIALGLSWPAFINARKVASFTQKKGFILIGLFGAGLFVSTVVTDVKYTAIFGEFHRNNGFLSYFAMLILMAAALLVFSLKSTTRYFTFFGIAGLILTIYGILQAIGMDPVAWKIEYNAFITTLGNPNFTSGFLGLSGIAILYLALDAKDHKFQLAFSIGLFANLYILMRSGSIQGVFGFAIGATVISLVKLWLINRKLGQTGLLFTSLLSAPVALAIMNVGPLASKLYQGTLRNRFDYWNAAINMFMDHPIFGVGVDRFGEYYRQYAVQNQVVQGQITDNAHSVYLQLLATGGIVMFIPYILLISFITFIGFKSMIAFQGQDKLKIAALFGIWLGMIAVNFVTVDSLGVGVWFWITGGVLLGATSRNVNILVKNDKTTNGKSIKSENTESIFPINYVISFALAILVLIIIVPSLGKSSTLYNLKVNANTYTSTTYVAKLVSESQSSENDTQYLIQLANLAFTQNAINEAFVMIDQINKVDNRSYYGNYFAAFALEALNKRSEAIKYRERLKELDPWNNSSLIELIKDYLSVDNKASAREVATLIKRNYPGSQSDIDASALLVG
jgi:O-antigen ligase